MIPLYRSFFVTSHGIGVVSASDHGVTGVDIPDVRRSITDADKERLPYESSEISTHAALLLQRYFQGERTDFSDIPLDISSLAPFRQKVLCMIRTLAFGEIRSYGQVAELCGSPRAARAVGGALAANPIPVIIPCHRVVASTGRLTGFSAPGGVLAKKVLLQLEGVVFRGMQVDINQLVIHRVVSR
jgi:methylated-DNA-[protein]-cysteine S-methyltransferase